jgi:mono/diheme cytochrome c family protein
MARVSCALTESAQRYSPAWGQRWPLWQAWRAGALTGGAALTIALACALPYAVGGFMRKAWKWLSRLAAVVLILLAVVLAAAYALSERRMAKVYQVDPAVPVVPVDAAAIARGDHIATIRGCKDCHGADLGGATFIDDPLFARLSGSNLTPGGAGGKLTDVDRVRAIRHGVAPDGRSLLFMPAQDFNGLGEQDMGDLLAYLHNVPAVGHVPPVNRVGPLGRLLFVAGKVPLLPAEIVDHTVRSVQPPLAGSTVAYGAYLATSCAGCHGKGFSGGHIPGTPPDWPDAANLTPDPSGLAAWSETDFRTALREGLARGGRAMKTDYMPVRVTKHFTDEEIGALYAYLRSLPAKRRGQG